ncbi:MAG: DUF2200 domain-containing protein [Flavobacteriales bacterium]
MKKITESHIQSMAKMTFAMIYPHYISKIKKKGRTVDELHQVIEWLTGFNENVILSLIEEQVNFAEFFERANLNPNASLIKGVICGYRIEEIDHDLVRQVRYLDKLVDDLAKGKTMEKILRKA